MITVRTQRKYVMTPLRYPGGKSSLLSFLDTIIKKHSWNDIGYIEPYTGGAGAAIALLLLEKVRSVVINDLDSAIYAFWHSIKNHNEEFIKLVEVTPVTIEEWKRQSEIYKRRDASELLKLGFATFFLNRTNHSGILNAGPIGGMQQTGNWKIDARYNKKKLIEKIRLIGLYSDRITVTSEDGAKVIEKYSNYENSFFYIDPPYFEKGSDLYMNSFTEENHKVLSETLKKYRSSKWVLSYDSAEFISQLYTGFAQDVLTLRYSASQSSKSGSELIVFSDSIDTSCL